MSQAGTEGPSTPESRRSSPQREALTRALANESRNALARVELAASELARGAMSPGLASRVSTIRAAVDEIDGLLAKIDLLSDVRRLPDGAHVDFAVVAQSVFDRLVTPLTARGLDVGWSEGEAAWVRVPRATLEALCIGFVRMIAGHLADGGSVRFSVRRCDERVWLVARGELSASPVVVDAAMRLELEVALAEWNGHLDFARQGTEDEIRLVLPHAPEALAQSSARAEGAD